AACGTIGRNSIDCQIAGAVEGDCASGAGRRRADRVSDKSTESGNIYLRGGHLNQVDIEPCEVCAGTSGNTTFSDEVAGGFHRQRCTRGYFTTENRVARGFHSKAGAG